MSWVPELGEDGIRRYGRNAARSGVPEDVTKCIAQVSDHDSRWPTYRQCDHKRGYGPDGTFCKAHAPREGAETWFRVKRKWTEPKVERVVFSGSTATQLIRANGRRELKCTQYDEYFFTFDEAKAALVKQFKAEVEGHKRRLHEARTHLGMAQSLKAEDHK